MGVKYIVVFLVTFLTLSLPSVAGTAEHFSYDSDDVGHVMAKLDQLEAFVLANPDISFEEVKARHSELVTDVSDVPILAMTDDDPALGIPSFLWGCCLGWVGILIVYLVTEDKEETKKALYGCLAAGLGCALFYVAYVLVWGYALSSIYWWY